MKKVVIRIFCLVLILCSFTTLYAIEDQFEISATVTAGADTVAPSVPTALSATAISTSQINLSWTASTDNIAVTGYRIYRDNAFVTTAVSTSYSDTGLSSDTLYAYTVSAIDAASNESARSATSSATTFTEEEGGGGGGGQYLLPIIYDVVISTTNNGASIFWKTRQDAVSNISWGATYNYEMGQSGETLYSRDHQITITGLTPGTPYLFYIEAISGRGATASFEGGFTTVITEEEISNPTNFTATPREKDILLNWGNPTQADFEEVRLVKQKSFYPSDPNDGEVIYEGKNESLVDSDVLVGTTYYYTLFAKDKNGKYSSGSLAKARIKVPGEPTIPEKDIFDSLPEAPSVHPLIQALTFLDFDFIQDGKKIPSLGKSHVVSIDGEKNLTVSLDYKKVPEVLKSIVITLTHPTDKTKIFSFLLRVNDEKTAYAATIGPLGESGNYEVKISIVDYKNRGLKKILGNLLAIAQIGLSNERGMTIYYFISFLILLLILLIVYKSLKKSLEKNKRKNESASDNA